jgi:hypothetical protein
MAAGTKVQAAKSGWLKRVLRWSWIKTVVALVLAGGAAATGWFLRPTAQEAPQVVGPSISVAASQKSVQANVVMTLTVGNRNSSLASTLRLTITPTQSHGPVTLTVTFNNFPARIGGTKLTSLNVPLATAAAAAESSPTAAVQPRAGPGYADYWVQRTYPPAGSTTRVPVITITTSRPLGESDNGTQLRVVFPKIVDEVPGINIPAASAASALYAGATTPPRFHSRVFEPTLLPGMSTFVSGSRSALPLAGFQILSGDPPTTLLGTKWAWNGINGATVLAADVAAEDNAQVHLFWAGLALGLAGGALVSAALEALTVLGRKDPAEAGSGGAGN